MNKIQVAVIAFQETDLGRYLKQIPQLAVQFILPGELLQYELEQYRAFFLLGSTNEKGEGLILSPQARNELERCRESGARLFCECCRSIGTMYVTDRRSALNERLVCHTDAALMHMNPGTILDNYASYYLPQAFLPRGGKLYLSFCGLPMAHSHMEAPDPKTLTADQWALWEEEETLLLAAFPVAQAVSARYAPHAEWEKLFQGIVRWTCSLSETVVLPAMPKAYQMGNAEIFPDFFQNAENAVNRAVSWFSRSGVLNQNGWTNRVYEGLSAKIEPDGTQPYAHIYRTDCAGETAMAFYAHYLMTGDSDSLSVSDSIEQYCFEHMMQQDGLLDGMVRWSQEAWTVCYADDVARFLLGSLYKVQYSGNSQYMPLIKKSLDFLLKTTGTNGLRDARTDAFLLTSQQDIDALAGAASEWTSAHYNAYYLAALILYGKLSEEGAYIKAGEKGLVSLMRLYPHTKREHSETQEQCRLVLPLALLYHVVPKKEYREWLYRVCHDLQKHLHKSGGYLEWDSDYSAVFSRKEGTECSLLAKNGDPVCDLLYSLNWLPLGFLQAWLATEDEWILQLWQDICRFLMKCQICSEDPKIDGAWARAVDVEKMEVFAMPNDAGWGPWAIESGWTVGEITAGMALGIYECRKKKMDGK